MSGNEHTDLTISNVRDFDTLLEMVGGWGKYQKTFLFLVMLAVTFPAMNTIHPVIISGDMAPRCKLPLTTGPMNSSVRAERCFLVYNASSGNDTVITSVACTEWEYSQEEYTSTLQSAYNLVCSRAYLAPLAVTLFFVGFLIGSLGYGIFSDSFGRLTCILTCTFHLCVFSIVTAFVNNFWFYATLRLVCGVASGGLNASLFASVAEIVSLKKRTFALIWVHTGWSIAFYLLAFVAYFVPNHVHIQLIVGVPSCLALLLFFFIQESPRWLHSAGRWKKMQDVLRKIAIINGNYTSSMFESLVVGETTGEDNNISFQTTSSSSILEVFRYRQLRCVTVVLCANWMLVSMSSYSIIFMLPTLGGNIYANLAILSSIAILASLIGNLVLTRLGRRIILVVTYAVASLALLVCALISTIRNGKRPSSRLLALTETAVAMFSFLNLTLTFQIIWLYSAEVYPTRVRNAGIGLGCSCARVGAMLAPLVDTLRAFWFPLPFLLLGAVSLVAAVSCLVLPETRGSVLPDTLLDSDRCSTVKEANQKI